MADDLILEHLRALRAGQDAIRSDLRDLKARMSSIESYVAAAHGDSVRQSSRLDEIESRVETIERRLELRDS